MQKTMGVFEVSLFPHDNLKGTFLDDLVKKMNIE